MSQIISDEIDFSAYLTETEGHRSVKPASGYLRDMRENLGKPEPDPGHSLPWGKVDRLFKFRPGEITLWAGVNGHGKSLMTGFVGVDLIAARQRLCVASFEMKPKRTLNRMLRQWTGANPDADWAREPGAVNVLRDMYTDFEAQSDGVLWLYDQQGTVKAETVIGVTRYCAKELGIKHMFVDSLMKCVKGEDDYNGQKYFVDELAAIARDYEMHMHLVHHIRKLENELKIPDKNDVKGSGSITDQVDNVMLVWRNKNPPEKRKDDDPEALLVCCKQRNGTGWEGSIKLWFDAESQQYMEAPPNHGGRVIDFSKRAA